MNPKSPGIQEVWIRGDDSCFSLLGYFQLKITSCGKEKGSAHSWEAWARRGVGGLFLLDEVCWSKKNKNHNNRRDSETGLFFSVSLFVVGLTRRCGYREEGTMGHAFSSKEMRRD